MTYGNAHTLAQKKARQSRANNQGPRKKLSVGFSRSGLAIHDPLHRGHVSP